MVGVATGIWASLNCLPGINPTLLFTRLLNSKTPKLTNFLTLQLTNFSSFSRACSVCAWACSCRIKASGTSTRAKTTNKKQAI